MMDKEKTIAFLVVGLAFLAMASEAPEEDELDELPCYPTFNKGYTDEFVKATEDCEYLPMKTFGFTAIREVKLRFINNLRNVRVESVKVRTKQECHFLCFTSAKCESFRYEEKPPTTKKGCDPASADCNVNECFMLTEKIVLTEGDTIGRKYVYGESDTCLGSMSQDAKDYFSSPEARYGAIKEDFLLAKKEYDSTNIASVHHYSYIATKCLGPLIDHGDITEDEMGISQSLLDGKLPYMAEGNPTVSSKTVSVTRRDVVGKLWVFTGLYAPPGKFVTVRLPVEEVGQFIIKIGANKDPVYKHLSNLRDPEVTTDFAITKSSQVIGSVYGGLIIVSFKPVDTTTGQPFDLVFENVIEAPLFNLDTDTNEDWNSRIKNNPAPWAVFRVPKKITFVLPTANVKHITDVTTNLKEYDAYMDDIDYSACVIGRKKGEIIVPDVQISAGIAHSGYPISSMNKRVLKGGDTFPPWGTINHVDMNLGLGHEIGHNVSPLEDISHAAINYFFNYALLQTRLKYKAGVWGRRQRLFSYIRAGKPDILDRMNYDVMAEVIKLPMGGLDGSGWDGEGSWEDLHEISCLWKGPKEGTISVYDKWARVVCKATQMNMLDYFAFWNFQVSVITEDICKEYSKKPNKMMAFISEVEDLVEESLRSCIGLDGWYGHQGKCYHLSKSKQKPGQAAGYCEDLGGELATIENEKDLILVQYATEKQTISLFTLGKVSAPANVIPYAENYDPTAEGEWQLTKVGTDCSYKPLKVATRCMQPVVTDKRVRSRVICQILQE